MDVTQAEKSHNSIQKFIFFLNILTFS